MIDIPDGLGDCTSLKHFLNKLQVYHHPVLVHLHTWVLVSSPPPSHSQTPPKHPSSSYFPKEKGKKTKKKEENQLTKTLQKLLLLLLLLLQFPKPIPKSIPAQVSSPAPSQNQTPLGRGGGGRRRAFLQYFPSNLSLHYYSPSHVSHVVQEDVSA